MALFADKQQRPFSGYPRTRLRKDWRRRRWYVVDIRHLSPWRAKIADTLGTLLSPALAASAAYVLHTENVTVWWVWAAGLLGPFALTELWRLMFRRLLRRNTRVKLNKDTIRIRGRNYDRLKVTGFTEDLHDQAFEEQERVTHKRQLAARMKGPPRRTRMYYSQETRVLFCEFADNRVEICTVLGFKDKQAILARLNRINDALNGDLGVGIGMAISPAADNVPDRGGIPE